MFARILEVCPSFEPQWRAFCEYWREEDDLPLYLALTELARHLIGMLDKGDTSTFNEVFSLVEEMHVEGDEYVRH
jgi:hypothetical protein